MEILSFLKSKKKKQFFVSENEFTANQDKQLRLSIESLVSLRDSAVEEEDELKIDYVFYTDSLVKAQKLEKDLQKLSYMVNHGRDYRDKSLYIIAGRTKEIKMMHETLREWIGEMCNLGYKYDCSFDSWTIVVETKK
jgi:hypothetical protein